MYVYGALHINNKIYGSLGQVVVWVQKQEKGYYF